MKPKGCGKCRTCGKIKDFTTSAWKTLSEFTTFPTIFTTTIFNIKKIRSPFLRFRL